MGDTVYFSGTSCHTIDAKGRLFIPQDKRDLLGTGFVLSLSEDMQTVSLYTAEAWKQKTEEFSKVFSSNRKAHELKRIIFGCTYTDIVPDSQGRILIPQAVRKQFGLEEGSEAVLLGALESLELWNKARYEAKKETWTQSMFDGLLDYMNELVTSSNKTTD